MIDSEVLEVRVGDVHVTPEQVADANIGTFGPDDYVLSTGRKLEAQVVTNNSVRVFDGVMVYGGIRDVISVNKYYDIQIDNGAQGMNRNDIIVRHFAITDEVTKRGGATFRVIKGTPSEGEAADPEIAITDLRAGALSHDMILHRVRIEGLNIVAVEPMYDVLYNAAELKEEVTELNRNFKESVYADGYMVVDIGALPNNSTKSVPTNIPSASEYWISDAWCKSRTTGQVSPMPYIDASTWSNAIGITISASKNIVVTTKADWSAYSGKAVIAYKL